MSRPFSYNDENFTVIGNVLFCHIKIEEAVLANQPIVEIPQEIYDRMLFFTQKFTRVERIDNMIFNTSIIDVGLKQLEDKKYVLFAKNPIFETNTYLVSFYILKDI